MKTRTKFTSFLMLLLLIGSIALGDLVPIVNAASSNGVTKTITSIEEKITNLKNKIELDEQDIEEKTNFEQQTILFIKEKINNLDVQLNVQKDLLTKGVALEKIVNSLSKEKQTIYDTYFSSSNIVIDITNIEDINYSYYDSFRKETREKTFLNRYEIEYYINNLYLNDLLNEVNSYLYFYNTIKNYYINSLTNVEELKEEKINDLNTKLGEIESFEEQELNNLNNPNMTINDKNIKDLILEKIIDINTEYSLLTIEDLTTVKDNITNIYNDTLDIINTFYLNNKNYEESGLKEKITNLTTTYDNLLTDYNNWFNTKSITDENTLNYVSLLDEDLINIYKNIINEEENYNNLQNDITIYLERKPSDREVILTDIEQLLNDYELINQERIINIITDLINQSNLEDEDVIDLLKSFLDFPISMELKDKINNAKLSFYELSLLDESKYQITRNNDYLILDTIFENLLLEDFKNNLLYTFKYEVLGNDIVDNDTKVILYDRKEELLKQYNIINKGDLTNDFIVDNNDIEEYKNLLLNKENDYSDTLDYNNDNKIDINDLVILNNKLNKLEQEGNTTTSNFEVTTEEKEGLIYYDITLKTNGIVNGFTFDLTTTNLTFKKALIDDETIITDDINKPTKVLGLGNYQNNQKIITLIYESTNNDNPNIIKLNNQLLVYDNGNTNNIAETLLTTNEKTIEEEPELNNDVEEVIKEENTIEEVEITKANNTLETKEDETIEEEPEKVALDNVIKIAIIVLLGAVIVYFLNKNETEEEFLKDNNKKEEK